MCVWWGLNGPVGSDFASQMQSAAAEGATCRNKYIKHRKTKKKKKKRRNKGKELKSWTHFRICAISRESDQIWLSAGLINLLVNYNLWLPGCGLPGLFSIVYLNSLISLLDFPKSTVLPQCNRVIKRSVHSLLDLYSDLKKHLCIATTPKRANDIDPPYFKKKYIKKMMLMISNFFELERVCFGCGMECVGS